MSMNFNNPINQAAESAIKKMFEGRIKAMDEKTVLFEGEVIRQSEMGLIARLAKQPVEIQMHKQGEIKTMSDGTQYQVTPQGWVKI